MDLIHFEWSRCMDGYDLYTSQPRRWVPHSAMPRKKAATASRTKSFTSTVGIRAKSGRFERYRPLAVDSTLFQRFADLPGTPKGMLQFAHVFGLPGGNGATVRSGNVISTAIASVIAEHESLRNALRLHQRGDNHELLRQLNARECRVTNLVWSDSSGHLDYHLEPSNLIDAIWLQLGLHAMSGATILKCLRCGQPIRVGPGTRRRNTAKYCSNACKVAAFKARQKGG